MKQKMEADLHGLLSAAILPVGNEPDAISFGIAMRRLLENPDFRLYQSALGQNYINLTRRLQHSDVQSLPCLQGAITQQDVIMRLPYKIISDAERVSAARREELEHEEERA